MPSIATPSTSGIIEASTGERHIPSSVRSDGTQRKEIKIRPGYRPPEDVEVYKNRTAEGFRNRGGGEVPGADGWKDDELQGSPSTASNKNAKRREARKRAKAGEENEDAELAKGDSLNGDSEKGGEMKKEVAVDEQAEREKRVRNLKKKLKQAKDLKEKKEGGAPLLPEQFAKVIKINELIRELDALGFDAEGEPKDNPADKHEAAV